MAKGKKSKKKNLRLRRQLRKTFGCLFMISALIVTAIPVTPTEAVATSTGWMEPASVTYGAGNKIRGFWKYSDSRNSMPWVELDGNGENHDIPIYHDESGKFRFVYVDKDGKWKPNYSDNNKYAMIVGYERNQDLPQGRLTIPARVDAYVKFADSGTNVTAAANRYGKPLYYKSYSKPNGQAMILDPEIRQDENGQVTRDDTAPADPDKPVFEGYILCRPELKSSWEEEQLYYFGDIDDKIVFPVGDELMDEMNTTKKWTATKLNDTDRISAAVVRYIGNECEYIDANGKSYLKASSAERSVFGGTGDGAAAGNIINLTFGTTEYQEVDSSGNPVTDANGNPVMVKQSPMIGIGDFAFNNCTNINNVTLGNGLNTLGNYVFANCRNLNTVQLDYNTNLQTLGAGAFSNCNMLQSFAIPTALQTIGDFCFQNCKNLVTMDLTGKSFATEGSAGLSVSLTDIGYKAFLNCESMENLELPDSYNGKDESDNPVFHLSTVQGCTSLAYIKTPSTSMRLVTDATTEEEGTDPYFKGGYSATRNGNDSVDGNYDFAAFIAEVGEDFWLEAPGFTSATGSTKTPVHNVANVKHICFKYLDEDRYEIVEDGLGGDRNNPQKVGLVFEVNKNCDLIKFHVEDWDTGQTRENIKVPEITMPHQVGPYNIKSIIEGSFNDKCYIEKITIPDTVVSIGSNAFKGSHNLKHILFDNATGIADIGSDAFATQLVSKHMEKMCNGTMAEKPFLSFTGDIVNSETGENTAPFKYAMLPASKVNEGAQPLTYITYYSGMPTNLAVQFNPDTGMSELQYFPTKAEAEKGFQVDANYEGGYLPFSEPNAGPYRFPYMTRTMETEVTEAITKGPVSENQVNLINGIENIVIPAGVNSIKKGLFSGINENGYLVDNPTEFPSGSESASGNLPYKAPGGDIKTLTVQSVAHIEPFTFARLSSLTNAYVNGAQSIGNYAFDRCENLQSARVSADTTELGLRPFSGCKNLSDLEFTDSAYFTVADGIIYGIEQDENKTKTKIIECLESRGSAVGSVVAGPDEFSTVTEIAPEAFMNCDMIASIDLSTSNVTRIPERCFAEMDRLATVDLPGSVRNIGRGSFWNTKGLARVKIPYSGVAIAPDAFAAVEVNEDNWTYGDVIEREGKIALVVNENSSALDYVVDYPYLEISLDNSLKGLFAVSLRDGVTEKVYDIKHVPEGDNLELTILDIPDHTAEGYEFERWSPDPSSINPITKDNQEITAMYKPIGATTYTVRFFDIEGKEMEEYTQQVEAGKSAKSPAKSEMEVEGKVFTGWDRDFSEITGPLDVHPLYVDRAAGKYYVSFYTDMDLATMIGRVQEVNEGESAIEPAHPTKEGYTFLKWSSDGWQNVTRDWEIFAIYTEGSGGDNSNDPGPFNVSFYTDSDLATRIGEVQVVNKGESAVEPEHPTKEGFTFSGWSTEEWKSVTKNLDVYAVYTDNNGNNGGDNNGGGDGGDDGDGDDNNDSSVSNNSVSNNGVKYKVVVNGGSGSGEYTAGTIVPINAYARSNGTVFDKWTSSSNGVGFVDPSAISTTFTMPSNDVTIEANFKEGKSSSSSSVSGNSRNRNNNSTTTVDVSKGGISNTDIASANVNGSSDNFVIRITDDATSTAAVIAALEARYGDLSNIAYLPMDISLYDADGTTKITDVSGITVDITLPLPDELIQYAGNNRAASVVDNRLEDLNTRFTTIDGIPCVQFTATHFSPYTIYVDTANLSAGTIDATPKTGDPIHPKWFLAMGLACISIVLFCKKDKQLKVKRA